MIGIDVVDVERLRALLDRSPGFVHRYFTREERIHCLGFGDPVTHFAGTLAAKEAVMKALNLVPAAAYAGRVEVVRGSTGAPEARFEHARVRVSITHDGPVAAAIALVSG